MNKSKTIKQIHSASRAITITIPILFAMLSYLFIYNLTITMKAFSNGYSAETAKEIGGLVHVSMSYLFILAILAITFKLFYAIKKEGTPFLSLVPKCIEIISVLLVFASPLPRWIDDLIAFSVQMELTIFNELDIIGLLAGGVLACLAIIFKYGCILQNQDDETL